jgi:starch synthase/alpha-amylase
LFRNYTASDASEGKRANKRYLQKHLGMIQNPEAPLFLWPSRLDPVQKGCQVLADILYEMVFRYHDEQIQVVFVANGVFQPYFVDIVHFHSRGWPMHLRIFCSCRRVSSPAACPR